MWAQLLEDYLKLIQWNIYHTTASLMLLCSSPDRFTAPIKLERPESSLEVKQHVLFSRQRPFSITNTDLLPLRASYSLRMSAATVGWLHSSSAEMNSSGQFSLLFKQSRRSTMLSKFPFISRLASMFSCSWIELVSIIFKCTAHMKVHIFPSTPTLSWSVRQGRWGIISLTFTLVTILGILRRRYSLYSLSLANVICEMKMD